MYQQIPCNIYLLLIHRTALCGARRSFRANLLQKFWAMNCNVSMFSLHSTLSRRSFGWVITYYHRSPTSGWLFILHYLLAFRLGTIMQRSLGPCLGQSTYLLINVASPRCPHRPFTKVTVYTRISVTTVLPWEPHCRRNVHSTSSLRALRASSRSLRTSWGTLMASNLAS